MMIRSSRSARRLAAGLRGFAKKRPDFYKQSNVATSTAEPASKNPGPPQAAGSATEASKAAQAATPSANGPASGAAAAAPSAAAAPKPAAPATPPAANAAPAGAAPKPAPAVTLAGNGAAAPAAPSAGAGAAPVVAPSAAAAAAPKNAPPTPATPSTTAAAAPKPAAPAPAAAPLPSAAAAAPKAAAGGSTGAGGGGGSGGGNSWLLHPAVPIDVRLLGAGLAGAGALAYSFAGGNDAQPPPKAAGGGVVEEASGFSMQPEVTAQAAEEAARMAQEATDAEAAAVAAGEAAGAAGPEAAAAEGHGQAPEGGQDGGVEEEPVYVDASQVLGVIEEVFSKEASEQLAALEAQAEAETAAAAAASQDAVSAAGKEAGQAAAMPAAAAPAAAAPAAAPAAPAAPAASKKGSSQAAMRRAEEEVAAMQAAVADQVGESVASAFVQSQQGAPTMRDLLQAGQKAEETQAEPAAAAAADAEAVARARELLGLRQDLSASGLIAEAVRLGIGPAADWSDYDQRHRQAEADSDVLARLLEAAGAHVAAQLAAASREGEAGRAEAAAARRQLAEQADSFRLVIKEAMNRAEEQQRQQLRRQAEQLATAHAEMTVRERAERAAKLDGVREKVNALERAFQRRSNEQRTSHEAHQLSLGVFALLSALAGGQPLGEALGFLQSLAGSDPVVAAAVQALPADAAAAPVPTRAQLSDQFTDVSRLTRQLSLLPEGQGGMLSLAVAKLAAKLKIAERGPLAASMPGDGIDRRLAAAQQAVVDGELLAAAAELEAAVAGTAAAPVVARWARAVRVRATAEQSAALLEAHAAAETASLA